MESFNVLDLNLKFELTVVKKVWNSSLLSVCTFFFFQEHFPCKKQN